MPKDLDVAHVVCGDDDVPVWMRAAGDVGGGFFWFCGGAVEIGGSGGHWRDTELWSVTVLGWGLGGGVGLGSADEGNRRRVTEVVEGVSGRAEELSGLQGRHDGGGYYC